MSPTSQGASNATDFQPTTRNPQGNVGGGLQPNSANLQPISNSSQSNVFNQPGVNPQAFPKTDSLRVLSTGTQAQTAASQPDTTPQGWSTLSLFFVAIAVALAIIILIVKTAKPADKLQEEKQEQAEVTPAVQKAPKSKKKAKNKKKTNKKRR